MMFSPRHGVTITYMYIQYVHVHCMNMFSELQPFTVSRNVCYKRKVNVYRVGEWEQPTVSLWPTFNSKNFHLGCLTVKYVSLGFRDLTSKILGSRVNLGYSIAAGHHNFILRPMPINWKLLASHVRPGLLLSVYNIN